MADRLVTALRTREPIAPLRETLGTDVEAAYRVQEAVLGQLANGGNARVGRKVGLTSESVQRQLGVDQPDFGVLLADMDATALAEVPSARLLQPRIEAELAFFLARDVDDPELVLEAVDCVGPALEIVDSRVADWDISIVDTIADNASSGMFVLGDVRVPLADIDTVAIEMVLECDGEVVSRGNGAACLGDPRTALLWVARTAHRLNRPLRAGEVVLSGALGPMVPFGPGTKVTATLTGLGSVSATAS
ncbi:fumarylacetoacetate hydrolase family protein [Microbacterium sp. NPDC077644]|uniref:2-keto-4-pentenoate hydratase n=1 Tax=Microbacterium sp. NPDC077644 TaxID=3155055 RepID=UPI003450B1D4